MWAPKEEWHVQLPSKTYHNECNNRQCIVDWISQETPWRQCNNLGKQAKKGCQPGSYQHNCHVNSKCHGQACHSVKAVPVHAWTRWGDRRYEMNWLSETAGGIAARVGWPNLKSSKCKVTDTQNQRSGVKPMERVIKSHVFMDDRNEPGRLETPFYPENPALHQCSSHHWASSSSPCRLSCCQGWHTVSQRRLHVLLLLLGQQKGLGSTSRAKKVSTVSVSLCQCRHPEVSIPAENGQRDNSPTRPTGQDVHSFRSHHHISINFPQPGSPVFLGRKPSWNAEQELQVHESAVHRAAPRYCSAAHTLPSTPLPHMPVSAKSPDAGASYAGFPGNCRLLDFTLGLFLWKIIIE